MSITFKQRKFLDEYFIDFNATQAAIRAGYAPKNARSTGYKILQYPTIKAELERRFKEQAMTPEEIIARLQAMADGDLPTTRITAPGKTKAEVTQKTIYDTRGALQDLAKVHALFIDRQQVETIQGLIIEDADSEDPDTPPASETG